ncbi:beta-fructosidase [Nodosilinea sp. LEGE 07298]|uniref:beta-fructosidase n=1 Tax=Nodosilinea sp. LEGE 07298 TaxID=2777970 RepID=UPI001880DCAA|nr:beta-fructosidase [Nodosilinea sp. LEGE 07298]MBE9111731.1 beta-fructosidase [Nodosilinea sp. LEGE 07298]
MPPSMQHPSRHVWDFWYHFDAEAKLFHIFYLNADRALVSSGKHHFASTVGHATTPDFDSIDWGDEDSFNILKPSPGHWANTSIWSGDVIKVKNGYLMFYTSRDRNQDDGLTQSIGVAYTDNLWSTQWQVLDTQINPSAAYQTKSLDGDLTFHAWRDPFLFRRQDGCIDMLVAAKTSAGAVGCNGAIALLTLATADFPAAIRGEREWNYLAPIAQPCCYAEMEVPQLYKNSRGSYELVFSTWAKYDFAPATAGQGGFQSLTLPTSGGTSEETISFSPSSQDFQVLIPESKGLYACRIVPELDGEIIGFDSQAGGIRRSGIKTKFEAMNRDFSDLIVVI